MSSKVLLASAVTLAAVLFVFAHPGHAPDGEGVAGLAPEGAPDLLTRASEDEDLVPATAVTARDAVPIASARTESIVLEGRVLVAATASGVSVTSGA